MDCWIKRDGWDNRLKGFPVYNEHVRSSAESWANGRRGDGNAQMIELPEMLSGCGIDGYDDRMNNKVFKVFAPITIRGQQEKLYFDMYADALVDLLMHGHVENGIIHSPLTFITRGRMVMVDGELHQEYVQKQQEKMMKKTVKVKSISDIKIGTAYRKTPGADNVFLYLGKWDGMHYEVKGSNWSKPLDVYVEDGKIHFPYWVEINESKSKPQYKEEAIDEKKQYSKSMDGMIEAFDLGYKYYKAEAKKYFDSMQTAPSRNDNVTGWYTRWNESKEHYESQYKSAEERANEYLMWADRMREVEAKQRGVQLV